MTFEFEYNTDTDQITIVYDGSCVLTASFDGEKTSFSRKFDQLEPEVENILKNLCRNAHAALA